MTRSILHIRVDAFPVAVERLRDSSLRGRPVAVCARHSPRSLVFSVSPEARREGVQEGLPLTAALRRCRSLTVIPPDSGLYRRAGAAVTRVLQRYSPLVEPGSWGRFYLDMSGTARLFGGGEDAACRIRKEVLNEVRLAGTLGIGTNKLVSGVAARVVQSHADLYAVPGGSEASFLAPLRVSLLPVLHKKKDREFLSGFNIRYVRQLADMSLIQLAGVFGKRAVLLHRQALGIDDRPVTSPAAKPFILEEITLEEDTNDDGVLLAVLYRLTEQACRRMRAASLLSRTAWLHLRYSDGMDVTRRLTFPNPTVHDRLLFPRLKETYLKASERRQRIRYLSLTFTDLEKPSPQTSLFDSPPEEGAGDPLIAALDTIRTRFGRDAVQWAGALVSGPAPRALPAPEAQR